MWLNVILSSVVALILAGSVFAETRTPNELERKIDSLFVIASSGEVRFRDLNKPAMDSIAALGAPAVPYLIEKFTTKSARERWTVIWILQRIGSPAVPDLVQALGRSNGLVVQRVCWALGDIKDTAAVEPLIEICTHLRWQVREQALGALGKISDKRGGSAAASRLDDSIGQVRKAAAVTCGKLEYHRCIPVLVHLLGDDFYGARMSAMEALLKLDTADVITVLCDSINSTNCLVGDMTCHILGRIGNDEAMLILLEQTKSDNPDRRAHAAVALVNADPRDNCGFQARVLERETDRLVLLKIQSAISTVINGQ